MRDKCKTTLKQITNSEDLQNKFKQLIIEEYLNSFMTIPDFCEKHKITHKAFLFVKDKFNLKKDMSKYNHGGLPSSILKCKQTKFEKYGNSNYSNIEAMRATMLEKYGVDHPGKMKDHQAKVVKTFELHYPKGSEEYKELQARKVSHRNSKLFAQRIKATYEKQVKEDPEYFTSISEKRIKTNQIRYGVDNVSQIREIKDKKQNTVRSRLEKVKEENDCELLGDLIKKYGQGFLHKKENIEFVKIDSDVFVPRKYIPYIEDYTNHLLPDQKLYGSEGEKEVCDFLKTFYKKEIKLHDRTILNGKELDIYLPADNVALEFNGTYWHSIDANPKNETSHVFKTKCCEERDIHLIHIFEDFWYLKKEIYKSLIKAKFGIYEKIDARKCECKSIDASTYENFLEKNHLQGSVHSSIRLGLFYGERLVAVAGWGKSRFKKGEFELHRFCNQINCCVRGGFSKLIKHSNLDSFISYVDRATFNGDSYTNFGFKLLEVTKPSYFYVSARDFSRVSRLAAQKHKLSKILKNYDPDLSESANMLKNGYFKIYDSGCLKLEYHKGIL